MGKIIDLTMGIHEGMRQAQAHGRSPLFLSGTLSHEGMKKFNYANVYNDSDLVSFANEHIIVCGHTGTHMDSCFHADPNSGFTIEKMPIDCGYGDAIWLDVSNRFGPNVSVTAKDLKEAEARTGTKIKPHDIVLIFTGWSTVKDSIQYSLQHMGISRDAAEWLREKNVKTVGIDASSVDVRGDISYPAHMNFLRPRLLGLPDDDFIAVIENLVNINKIPQPRFTFSGAPIPYVGQTGGQVRALAIIS